MSGTDAHHELAIGNGTQSLALGPDWRWFHVNSWRVVIGDRRSLTIGAGGFEAIRYKVPGLRHGQQVARVLSALVCEPSVLFQALFVVHRFLPASRLRIGPSVIMLPSRQIAVGSTRNSGTARLDRRRAPASYLSTFGLR
jgi:hypothetical protein